MDEKEIFWHKWCDVYALIFAINAKISVQVNGLMAICHCEHLDSLGDAFAFILNIRAKNINNIFHFRISINYRQNFTQF